MKAFFNSSATGYGLLWWADADNLSQFDDFAVTASDQPPGSPPTLSGLLPTSGRPGATFTLIGSSFSVVQGSSTVRLNGMAGTILSWSGSHIVTTIPSAVTGGPVAVQVIVAGHASNTQMFQVIPNCTYTLSPPGATVPAGGGTTQFTVTTPAGCAISPVHNADWVSVSVSGRTVTIQVAANVDRNGRSATVTVGTAAFVGTQNGDLVVPDEPTSSTAIYYHTDAIGSVRLTTDQTGQELARYDFAPFGEGPPASAETRQFAGAERDAGTNFDYLGARYYAGILGRFTQPDDSSFVDPVNPQSMNLYAYVNNNPLRYKDPTGHSGDCVGDYDATSGKCQPVDSAWEDTKQWLSRNLFSPLVTAASNVNQSVERFIERRNETRCQDVPAKFSQFGVSVTAGGSPLLAGMFGGGGAAFGLDVATGQIYLTFQANGMLGAGLYAGVGTSLTVGSSQSGMRNGWNAVQRSSYGEANFAFARTATGGITGSSDNQGISASYSIGPGAAWGGMVATGRSQSITVAGPGVFCH